MFCRATLFKSPILLCSKVHSLKCSKIKCFGVVGGFGVAWLFWFCEALALCVGQNQMCQWRWLKKISCTVCFFIFSCFVVVLVGWVSACCLGSFCHCH